jgi:hypothetical protein
MAISRPVDVHGGGMSVEAGRALRLTPKSIVSTDLSA